jgi:hypothetical protein
MVRNQAPCIANGFRLLEDLPQSFQKVIPVGIGSEYRPPFNASDHDIVERTCSADSRLPWHAPPLPVQDLFFQLKNLTASPFTCSRSTGRLLTQAISQMKVKAGPLRYKKWYIRAPE